MMVDLSPHFVDNFVACGFDKVPYLFKKNGKSYDFVKILDEGFTQVKQSKIAQGSFEQSKAFFNQKQLARSGTVSLDDEVIMREKNTKH